MLLRLVGSVFVMVGDGGLVRSSHDVLLTVVLFVFVNVVVWRREVRARGAESDEILNRANL